MIATSRINAELQRLVDQPGWCFAVGLRIRFNHPALLYQTYPESWVTYYAQNGLLFSDPTVMWGMTHTGTCEWADLEATDSAGVLTLARGYGLVHGIIASVGDQPNRSIGFFARPDRRITAAETDLALDVVTQLHDLTEGVADVSPAQLGALADIGLALRRGISPA